MILPRFSLFFLLIFCFASEAIKIRFPDEDLAKESVLPVFDPMYMVVNRNVSLKNRVELGLSAQFGLDQAFYSQYHASGLIAFYFSEVHGIALSTTYFYPGYSGGGLVLAQGKGLTNQTFDARKVPYPHLMSFLNYQYTPYYGKISLTKKFTMNLSIYGFLGPGTIFFSEKTMRPAFNLGFGQKLYFANWIAIRGDVGAYAYYGPRPELLDLSKGSFSFDDIRREGKERISIYLVTSLGLVFLI